MRNSEFGLRNDKRTKTIAGCRPTKQRAGARSGEWRKEKSLLVGGYSLLVEKHKSEDRGKRTQDSGVRKQEAVMSIE